MDVSIVIVSFNTRQLLDDCIFSIKQETRCCQEIIVVDNASIDGTCAMLRKKHNDVTIVENDKNVGFAKANNQGFARGRGKYFFMLNPDTIVLNGAIDKLFEFMERHQDVGICGPRNIAADGKLQYNCDHFPNFWNTFWIYSNFINRYPNIKAFKKSRMQYWDYSKIREVESIAGCSLLIRAELFKQLDGLDTNYFMYFEETDLCYRSIKKGYRVLFVPYATILHYGGESSQAQTQHKVIDNTLLSYYLPSQYYFYKKNYGILPMFAIRSLDFFYGSVLLMRNILRKDNIKRAQGLAKGKQLCVAASR